MQRFENGEELCRARSTATGREVEQHDADAPLAFLRATQRHQLCHARRQRFGAFGAALHGAHRTADRPGAAPRTAGAGGIAAVRAATEHHWRGTAIKFGNGDHDGRFERQ